MRQRTNTGDLGEVLIEITFIGSTARVAAIHVATNVEVRVVCPASYKQFSLEQAALRKLRYVLKRDRPELFRGR